MNKTIKLYDTNAYDTAFHATILECNKVNDEYDVILDQTLFFPTSGGQLCDKGTLNNIPVNHVEIEGEVIHHYLNQPLEGKVEGIIDFNHRYDMMQNHSGEHLFSGIVHQMYGYDNVGFHLGKEEMTVDFNGYLDSKQLEEIEMKVNQVIQDNIEIQCFYVDDASQYNYRSKKEIDGDLRLCVIEGVDTCACCAPHVHSTIEVRLFKILKSMKYKEGVRVYLACGTRAICDYMMKHNQDVEISQMLSLPPNELKGGVERLINQVNELKKELSDSKKELLDLKLSQISHTHSLVLFENGLDTSTLRDYALKLFDLCDDYILVLNGLDNDYQFVLLDHQDVISRLNMIKQSLNLTGGGKPPMVQGKIKNTREEIENVMK